MLENLDPVLYGRKGYEGQFKFLKDKLKTKDISEDNISEIFDHMLFHIPFHYGFRISRKGVVFDLNKNIVVVPTCNKLGYPIVTVRRNKVSKRSVSQYLHRLLALTFLVPAEHRADMKRIYVNHKDGDKLNNALDNLEWCTPSQNCIHAFQTGLRPDNRPIQLTCAKTEKVHMFNTQKEAAGFLGVCAATLCVRIDRYIKLNKPYRGYFLKRI